MALCFIGILRTSLEMLTKHMGLSAEAARCIVENGIFLCCEQNKCSICGLAHLICHSMCHGRVLFCGGMRERWVSCCSCQVSEHLLGR